MDAFEFQKARIVGGDERAGVGVMGGLRVLDGLREKGMGNLLGDEERGITSVEEGLGEVSRVGEEVIWVMSQEKNFNPRKNAKHYTVPIQVLE